MNGKIMRSVTAALAISTMLATTGCGRWFGDSGESTPVAGNVVQSPVAGATVFADKAPYNGIKDAGEKQAEALTAVDGSFTINIPGNYGAYRLVSTGGTDAQGNPGVTMLAPPLAEGVTTSVLSPLSTLFALSDNPAQLEATLGVTATTNPYTDPIPPATLGVMKAMENVLVSMKTASTTAGVENQAVSNALQLGLAKQLADALVLQTADTIKDVAVIKTLVTDSAVAAFTAVDADPTVGGQIAIADAAALQATVSAGVGAVVDAVNAAAPVNGPAVSEQTGLPPAVLADIKTANDTSSTSVDGSVTVTPPATGATGGTGGGTGVQ